MRIYTATSKATGERYDYLAKEAWNKRYYSCDLVSIKTTWFPSLKLAKQAAIKNGTLRIFRPAPSPTPATATATAAQGVKNNMNAITMTTVNGNPFPSYEGQALSWSIGLYHTHDEQMAGFPRARAVIRAMREHRMEQLQKERCVYLTSSFDKMFGMNAKRMFDLIEEELAR